MTRKEIVAELLKNGATEVKDCKVKNVTVTHKDNYVRLALTLDKNVKGIVAKAANEDGEVEFEVGETNVIFVSSFAIGSLLKDNDDAAFAAQHLIEHPEAFQVILSRATINVLQEFVPAKEEYRNPWSNNADNAVTFDHDTFINSVIKITLSDFAIRKLDKLADKLLDI